MRWNWSTGTYTEKAAITTIDFFLTGKSLYLNNMPVRLAAATGMLFFQTLRRKNCEANLCAQRALKVKSTFAPKFQTMTTPVATSLAR